jgi:hypothetical protein
MPNEEALKEQYVKRTNALLWFIIILFVGFALWAAYTGKLDSTAGSFIDGVWSSLEGMVRPIFHR